MKVNIGENYFTSEYTNILPKYIDDIDDGEAEEIRCCFILSKLTPGDARHFCGTLVKKLAVNGTLVIEDIDFLAICDNYYWDKINIQDVNNALFGCRCFLDVDSIRQLVPLSMIRSKIDNNRFLLEFKRENDM